MLSKPTPAEFFTVLRKSFVAAMGGGAAVLATLAAAFAPKLVNPVFVGLSALTCGILAAYAIWADERAERVTLQGQLPGRPFVTVTYSQNATEDEPNVFDTMVFENVGQEVAVSIDIATEPQTFGAREIRPRLVWGAVTKLKPNEPEEKSVTSVDSFLRDLRAAVTRRDGRGDDIRVPLTVTYSDTRERKWAETHALLYNGYGIWIENVTGRAPVWTDLHGIEVEHHDGRTRPAG